LTIGTPDELRHQLFSTVFEVRTTDPVEYADDIFSRIDGVQQWQCRDAAITC